MHRNILVPTDGSDECASALEEAIDLATTYNATVHVLYVVDMTTRGGRGLMAIKSPRPDTELREIGTQATARMARKATEADVTVTTAVQAGIPYETIIEYGEENDIDVIVMSSHKRSGVRRFIFGSVTERVTRATEIPVIVVQRGSDTTEIDTEAEAQQEQATIG